MQHPGADHPLTQQTPAEPSRPSPPRIGTGATWGPFVRPSDPTSSTSRNDDGGHACISAARLRRHGGERGEQTQRTREGVGHTHRSPTETDEDGTKRTSAVASKLSKCDAIRCDAIPRPEPISVDVVSPQIQVRMRRHQVDMQRQVRSLEPRQKDMLTRQATGICQLLSPVENVQSLVSLVSAVGSQSQTCRMSRYGCGKDGNHADKKKTTSAAKNIRLISRLV